MDQIHIIFRGRVLWIGSSVSRARQLYLEGIWELVKPFQSLKKDSGMKGTRELWATVPTLYQHYNLILCDIATDWAVNVLINTRFAHKGNINYFITEVQAQAEDQSRAVETLKPPQRLVST